MNCRVHGTNRLARSALALLTGNRLGNHFNLIIIDNATSRLPVFTLLVFFSLLKIKPLLTNGLVVRRTGKVAIHSDPVHLTSSENLILANNRDIVFRLA